MKTKDMLVYGIIAIIACSAFGIWDPFNLGLSGFLMGSGVNTGGGNSQLMNTLDFLLIDKYAGAGQNSMSIKVYEGTTLVETCTTASDGSIETVRSYKSGQPLNLLIDEGSNEHWVQLIVPTHDPAKVEASDPTPINLAGSDHPTLTDLVHDESGTAIADAGKLNYTAKGSTELITYTWFVSADNSGLLPSGYDPLDGYTPQVVMYVTLSDTTNHIDSGYDGSFLNGASMVYYKYIDPADVSKWKVGSSYVYDGSTSVSFMLDISAASGTGDTVQIDLYEADDPAYYRTHLAHAPYATALCESTISLDNT